MFRLLIPYVFLLAIIFGYFYYRRKKLGPVLLKMDRVLFSRHNIDSLLLVIIIAGLSYFLARFEVQNVPLPEEPLLLGPFSYSFFYGFLMLVVIGREIERPTIREKGIASSRGFWSWHDVESYRWGKDVITFSIVSNKKKRLYSWQIAASTKKEVDQILKKNIKKPFDQSRMKKK